MKDSGAKHIDKLYGTYANQMYKVGDAAGIKNWITGTVIPARVADINYYLDEEDNVVGCTYNFYTPISEELINDIPWYNVVILENTE